MNISFENKVALVTGAASGLGLATAKAFAESGAAVVLADWNEKSARAAADELVVQGHKALAVVCDVSDDSRVEAMVAQTVATFGQLDAAYNNAGVQNVLAETADSPREDYDRRSFQGVVNKDRAEGQRRTEQIEAELSSCLTAVK
jgi:NAD(P)-dependent dehydrogenase (short-subunit alcohol dehydrogenase family)